MCALGEDSFRPLKLGHTGIYILPSSEGAVLMDLGVGTPENWEKLVEEMKRRGYAISDVRAALLTHAHFDHVGQLRRLRAESEAEILIHEDDAWYLAERFCHMGWTQKLVPRQVRENGVPAEIIDGRWSGECIARWDAPWFGFYAPSTRPGHSGLFPPGSTGPNWHIWEATFAEGASKDPNYVPTHPDRTFSDGEELVFGDLRIIAYHTPGHCMGHAVFYHPDSAGLFSGDHLLKGITPNPVIEFPRDIYERRSRGFPSYLRSLEHIKHLNVQTVFPAHGEIMADFESAISAQEHHIKGRGERIWHLLKGKDLTAYDIVMQLYPRLEGVNMWTALNRVMGQLDLLEDEGRVAVEFRDGLFVYRAT